MRVPLRPYQSTLKAAIVVAWLTVGNVLAVSATGSGKTVLFADVIHDEPGAVCAIAHRQELVGQISLALARNGIRHRIVGSDSLRRECVSAHMDELKCSYVDPNSRVTVAGVDTLTGKNFLTHNADWCASVRLWVLDEAHHLLRHNKWGKAVAMFPNARGLGVTAETERADGCGLGANNDGVFNEIVVAPGMRDIIGMGFLTDYRVFVPPSDFNRAAVAVTASGDFSHKELVTATRASHITGDVVAHYMRLAPGKLGITFAVDIETAHDIANGFRLAGVPAEVVTSKTPDPLRRSILRRFKAREILQLVNVDLFGEGFDLPAIEVVSMARATESFNLYKQQFGRALRLLTGKSWAIIIDHVGNVLRHGLPDKRKEFSLDRREKRSSTKIDENLIPLTVCSGCAMPYERVYRGCPFCGHSVVPAARSAPMFVDGDLLELTGDVLARMRGDADAAVSGFAPVPEGVAPYVAAGIRNRHHEKRQAQESLRTTLELWAGWQRSRGRSDSEIYRTFYLVYGTDMLTACTFAAKDAEGLRDKIQSRLDAEGVVCL